jgi:hypothetical protein
VADFLPVAEMAEFGGAWPVVEFGPVWRQSSVLINCACCAAPHGSEEWLAEAIVIAVGPLLYRYITLLVLRIELVELDSV